jgi:hypothetical protein
MYTERHDKQTLADLVDTYQASGRYVFTRDDALGTLGVTEEALKKAVQRLVTKRRLAVPLRGFSIIVPIEYREAAAPPASWFIDDLMKFYGQPYYVGLLTAAALHGSLTNSRRSSRSSRRPASPRRRRASAHSKTISLRRSSMRYF